MKHLTTLLTVFVFVFAWSCGGNSETKKEATTDTDKKVEKSYSLSTKEGMLMKIKEFNIDIPSELAFAEVKRNSTDYVARFEATELDDATVERLQNWFDQEVQELINEGWRARPLRENDEMMGSILNQVLFYRAIEGSSLQDAIDFSSTYQPKTKTYKIFISFAEV